MTTGQASRRSSPPKRPRQRRQTPESPQIVDLFAGAGGWEEALCGLARQTVGVENDPWPCATARVAGHRRIQADVAGLDPRDFAPVEGLIASPPCQAYSTAGKKLGRLDKPLVMACARELASGEDARAKYAIACRDERSLLTVEPLRWALVLRPRWIALEQVPPVLELWRLFAELLAGHGYHTDAGVLSAERYGLPQTRRRAFLVASLDGPVALPDPTHRSFDPRCPDRLLGEERGLLPWVSMAQALGWTGAAITYTHSQTDSGRRPRGLARPLDRPARTLDTSSGSWTIEPEEGHKGRCTVTQTPAGYDSRQGGARVRLIAEPAPTLTATGLAKHTAVWVDGQTASTTLARDKNVRRITVAQAAVLQGFVADYPWQGSRARRFQQIGNAVCPPLAGRVVAEAMRPTRWNDDRD